MDTWDKAKFSVQIGGTVAICGLGYFIYKQLVLTYPKEFIEDLNDLEQKALGARNSGYNYEYVEPFLSAFNIFNSNETYKPHIDNSFNPAIAWRYGVQSAKVTAQMNYINETKMASTISLAPTIIYETVETITEMLETGAEQDELDKYNAYIDSKNLNNYIIALNNATTTAELLSIDQQFRDFYTSVLPMGYGSYPTPNERYLEKFRQQIYSPLLESRKTALFIEQPTLLTEYQNMLITQYNISKSSYVKETDPYGIIAYLPFHRIYSFNFRAWRAALNDNDWIYISSYNYYLQEKLREITGYGLPSNPINYTKINEFETAYPNLKV